MVKRCDRMAVVEFFGISALEFIAELKRAAVSVPGLLTISALFWLFILRLLFAE